MYVCRLFTVCICLRIEQIRSVVFYFGNTIAVCFQKTQNWNELLFYFLIFNCFTKTNSEKEIAVHKIEHRSCGKMKLGLLIWKNGLIRLRHPVRTIFEIIWPLLIFVILIRDSNKSKSELFSGTFTFFVHIKKSQNRSRFACQSILKQLLNVTFPLVLCQAREYFLGSSQCSAT